MESIIDYNCDDIYLLKKKKSLKANMNDLLHCW